MNFLQVKDHTAAYLEHTAVVSLLDVWVNEAVRLLENGVQYRNPSGEDDQFLYKRNWKSMERVATFNQIASTKPLSDFTRHKEQRYLYVTVDGRRKQVQYADPKEMLSIYADSSQTGVPERFTVEQGSIIMAPAPDKAYDFTYGYYGYSATMTADNDTNWWTENYPTLITCVVAELAEPYLLSGSASAFTALKEIILSNIASQEEDSQFEGGYLVIRNVP